MNYNFSIFCLHFPQILGPGISMLWPMFQKWPSNFVPCHSMLRKVDHNMDHGSYSWFDMLRWDCDFKCESSAPSPSLSLYRTYFLVTCIKYWWTFNVMYSREKSNVHPHWHIPLILKALSCGLKLHFLFRISFVKMEMDRCKYKRQICVSLQPFGEFKIDRCQV